MTSYQTAHYNVIREPAGDGALYVVTNLAGKVLRGPMALSAACEIADLYQADDDADAIDELRSAELDGP